jgi:hypothetical protein
MICRNCGERVANRPRGLCWTCYYTAGVRDRYPSTSKFAHREIEDFYGQARPVLVPTMARPGSREKIAVLSERASRRQVLWHPLDASLLGRGQTSGRRLFRPDPTRMLEEKSEWAAATG